MTTLIPVRVQDGIALTGHTAIIYDECGEFAINTFFPLLSEDLTELKSPFLVLVIQPSPASSGEVVSSISLP